MAETGKCSRAVMLGACLVLFVASGCATRQPVRSALSWKRDTPPPAPQASLETVAGKYYRGCDCGTRLSNNCAHFLSNAFILAGYTELLDSPLIAERCPAGRPIRAQDMLRWFQSKSRNFHAGIPASGTGFYAAYQEKPDRRHVMILDTGSGKYFGTDNCVAWPVQWYYQW